MRLFRYLCMFILQVLHLKKKKVDYHSDYDRKVIKRLKELGYLD